MLAIIRFLWNSTRGYHCTPWKSPYVKWRVETFTGMKAEEMKAADIFRFVWRDKGELFRYLLWVDKLAKETRSVKGAS